MVRTTIITCTCISTVLTTCTCTLNQEKGKYGKRGENIASEERELT